MTWHQRRTALLAMTLGAILLAGCISEANTTSSDASPANIDAENAPEKSPQDGTVGDANTPPSPTEAAPQLPGPNEQSKPMAEGMWSEGVVPHNEPLVFVVESNGAQWALDGAIQANGTGNATFQVTGSGVHDVTFTTANGTTALRGVIEGEPIQFGPEPTKPEDGGWIQPGTNHNGCTVNFLFTYHHLRYFVGTAAHCVDDIHNETGSHGPLVCNDRTLTESHAPIGTLSRLGPSGVRAPIAYSSWLAMHELNETDPYACNGNDFALLEIPPQHYSQMHPAVRFHGGPTCLHEMGAEVIGDTVFGFGSSNLWAGQDALKPKQGLWYGPENTWQHNVYFAFPGIPGDSGSPMLDANGCAMGVASTISFAPFAGSNDYVDVGAALRYMEANLGWAPTLLTWDDWHPQQRVPT